MCYLYVATNEYVNDGKPLLNYQITDMIPFGLSIPAQASRVQIDDRGVVKFTLKVGLAEAQQHLMTYASERGWVEQEERRGESAKRLDFAFAAQGKRPRASAAG